MNTEIIDRIIDLQVLWIIGATEQLTTLGLVESTPFKITEKGLDLFLSIDEYRDSLFPDDAQMKDLLKYLIISENETHDQELLDVLFYLVSVIITVLGHLGKRQS